MRLPRGIKLVNERVEGNELVYDLEIAWWRRALLVLKATHPRAFRERRH